MIFFRVLSKWFYKTIEFIAVLILICKATGYKDGQVFESFKIEIISDFFSILKTLVLTVSQFEEKTIFWFDWKPAFVVIFFVFCCLGSRQDRVWSVSRTAHSYPPGSKASRAVAHFIRRKSTHMSKSSSLSVCKLLWSQLSQDWLTRIMSMLCF